MSFGILFILIVFIAFFVYLLSILNDDPNTIQGKIKLFFLVIAKYLKSRIRGAMKNKFFCFYFIYCALVHFIHNYTIPNILKKKYGIEQLKNNTMYYILFFFYDIMCNFN